MFPLIWTAILGVAGCACFAAYQPGKREWLGPLGVLLLFSGIYGVTALYGMGLGPASELLLAG